MSKRILITGAGSGLGEGAAIGLAKAGHHVIATAEIWPQVSAVPPRRRSSGSTISEWRSSTF
jgi:NAD(P)-dependent dehydrogenase (short-subunit alcohol dehydrogenase family)